MTVANVGCGTRWARYCRHVPDARGRTACSERRNRVVLTHQCWRQVFGKLMPPGGDGGTTWPGCDAERQTYGRAKPRHPLRAELVDRAACGQHKDEKYPA